MSEEIQAFEVELPSLLFLSVPMVILLTALHRGRLPFARFRLPTGPQEPALWGAEEVLIAFAAWFVSQIVASSFSYDGTMRAAGRLLIASTVSTAVLCAVILHLVHGGLGQPPSTLGLKHSHASNGLAVVAFYCFLLVPLATITIFWSVALRYFLGIDLVEQPPVELFRTGLAEGDTTAAVCLVLAGVVLAPIGEELLFRGLIFGWMKARWGRYAGALVTALLFAAVHVSLSKLAPLFVLGLALVYVYERTGSIYFSMLFHAIFNGVSFASILSSAKT